jgi:cytochrome c oxidase subunit 2
MLKRGAGVLSGIATAAMAFQVRAAPLLGQPTPGGIELQPSASPLRDDQAWLLNWILHPVAIFIATFVLFLLLVVIIKFNRRANPSPARWSHNTPIEVIWTIVPVMILAIIAVFSFRLLYKFHDIPHADVTVKATGNQWYWTYEYPDLKVPEYTSNPLDEDKAKAAGEPYMLAVDNPIVAPVGKVVRVLTTGADVIHSWTIPAFGVKIDAIPGRLNQTWFKAKQVGTYYGQCSELCGINHSFMPIAVRVVTQPEFDAWVAAHAKKEAAPAPAPAASSAPAAPPSSAPAASAAPAASSAPAAH